MAPNYNKELYQKYPGLKLPLVNTDGRDLGPEARQQMQAPPTMLPNPTPSPGVSVSPFPLVSPNKPVGNLISSSTFSNIALHVNSDNNTTLAFAYWDPTGKFIESYGTWTLNAKGALIGASGPVGFAGLKIINIAFDHAYLVVEFAPSGQSFSGGTLAGPFTVWVLDEFGHLVSAVGNQTLGQGLLGSVTLSGPNGSPNQLWHWVGATYPPLRFELAAEEFDSSGNFLSGYTYGPF